MAITAKGGFKTATKPDIAKAVMQERAPSTIAWVMPMEQYTCPHRQNSTAPPMAVGTENANMRL